MLSTTSLIDSLVADLEPVSHRPALPTLLLGVAAGAAVTLGAVLLRFGVQDGLAGPGLPAFLMKNAYVLSLGGLALAGARNLARPGADRPDSRWLTLPVAALFVLAMVAVLRVAPAALPGLLLGGSWRQCPVRIALLSLPIFAGVFAALRAQAPVHLRRAGAAAGLVAGAAAAALYALACTESSPAFVLIWYSLGIALSTGLGALLGPRLLRW